VQPLRRERADQFGLRCVVDKRKLVDATSALTAGDHGGPAMEVDRPRRARRLRGSAPRSRTSALKHTTFLFFLGSRGGPPSGGGRCARADHKFLIVPQCTLSAGIGLCCICDKRDNSWRFCWFFGRCRNFATSEPSGHAAHGPWMSRTETARSATNA
jgi:hypothetical protein